MAAFALAWALRGRLPARLSAPLAAAGLPVLFLCLWSLIVFFGYQALIPAASSSQSRLTCMLLAGGMLLCGVGAAGAARVLFPAHSAAAALAGTLIAMLGTGNAFHWQRRNLPEAERAFQMVDYLRGLDLAPGTKLYSWPNQHFCLTFLTGLPVQSVAPVRAEFFDRHDGDVVILETVPRVPQPPPERVQALARAAGAELSEAEALAWAPRLRKLMIQAQVVPLVTEFVIVDEEPAPAWAAAIVPELLAEGEQPGPADINFAHDNPAMFKGLPPLPMDEFWPAFFYRFVGIEGRRGAGLNYAARMRAARAELLPCNWLAVLCPARHLGAQ
jgi:hypothetical protein